MGARGPGCVAMSPRRSSLFPSTKLAAEQQLDSFPWLGGQFFLSRLSGRGCKGVCLRVGKRNRGRDLPMKYLKSFLSLTVYFINKNDMKRSTRTNVFTRYKYNKIEE